MTTEDNEAIERLQKRMHEDDMIDTAIEQIKKDIEAGDVSAIFELLRFVPEENLIAYLPEDQQKRFKPLVHD